MKKKLLTTSSALATCFFLLALVSACGYNSQPERLRRFAAAQEIAEQSNTKPLTPDRLKDSSQHLGKEEHDTIPRITHSVRIRTSEGSFTLGLYGKDAPRTVENFTKLVERKFYRNTLIHRIAKDFVIQMGDPKTKDKRKRDEWGTGGESAFGESFEIEIQPDAPSVKRGFKRGTVAMANRGAASSTSQFFICLHDTPDMPLVYTIFGEVTEGLETIDSIASQKIIPVLNKNDGRPVKTIVLESLNVRKIKH